jgi:serine/threonine protein kinase
MAPEQICHFHHNFKHQGERSKEFNDFFKERKSYYKKYFSQKESDIWSAGILLYVMIYGNQPFTGIEDEIINLILSKPKGSDSKYILCPDSASKTCIDLIERILKPDIEDRLTLA